MVKMFVTPEMAERWLNEPEGNVTRFIDYLKRTPSVHPMWRILAKSGDLDVDIAQAILAVTGDEAT